MPSIDRVIENLGSYIKAKATTGEEVELKECVQLACLSCVCVCVCVCVCGVCVCVCVCGGCVGTFSLSLSLSLSLSSPLSLSLSLSSLSLSLGCEYLSITLFGCPQSRSANMCASVHIVMSIYILVEVALAHCRFGLKMSLNVYFGFCESLVPPLIERGC